MRHRPLVHVAQAARRAAKELPEGAEGRRVHIGARVEVDVVADEVVQILRVVDGLNRFRFAGDPDLMAAWRSASNVVGPPKPAAKDAGEIEPAA